MIIHNTTQGTEEWLNLRKGVATASNFSKIITSTGEESATLEKYAFSLLTKIENGYSNTNMQRGNDLEPFARQAYQEETLNIVEQCGFITSDCGNFGYSPDGLVGNNGLIEIKCPLAKTHFGYIIDNKCPSKYYAQVQGGLFMAGRQWCDFVSYHPDFKQPLFICRVERDEEFIKNLDILLQKLLIIKNDFLEKFGTKK